MPAVGVGTAASVGRNGSKRPVPVWPGKPIGAAPTPTGSCAAPATSTRCRDTAAAYAAGEIYGAHVDWSRRATGRGATPPSPTPKSCWSSCVARRWFDRRRGRHRVLEAARRPRRRRPRRRHRCATAGHLSRRRQLGGEVVIDGVLDPLGGEIFKTELRTPLRTVAPARSPRRRRTHHPQRRADALVEMAMRAATAPADGLRPRPLLTVTIGIEHFNHCAKPPPARSSPPDC